MARHLGFAAMSPEKQQEIASLGGRAAHARGTAHKFTVEEARAAGRKGGLQAQLNRNRCTACFGTGDASVTAEDMAGHTPITKCGPACQVCDGTGDRRGRGAAL